MRRMRALLPPLLNVGCVIQRLVQLPANDTQFVVTVRDAAPAADSEAGGSSSGAGGSGPWYWSCWQAKRAGKIGEWYLSGLQTFLEDKQVGL